MNLFVEILKIVKRDPDIAQPELVGDVVATHADGTVTVELPGGGQVRARGTAAVSDRVFVKGGVLTGPAPDLPFVTVEE